MRIAFVTPEFITEFPDGGGLGNYLFRMTKLLVEDGHEVELFVPSDLKPSTMFYHGIRVWRVPRPEGKSWIKAMTKLLYRSRVGRPIAPLLAIVDQAIALAHALERRHREAPFAIIQSADYRASGLAIRPRAGRVHVVRCSSAADMYNIVDKRLSLSNKLQAGLERAAIRRAQKAYAPSKLVAEHYQTKHKINVAVVRPPFALETTPSTEKIDDLPARFLIHFGRLSPRKGTDWLVDALQLAFAVDPTIQVVLAGHANPTRLEAILAPLGAHQQNVRWLGALKKPQLYAVLQQADAAVLPSLVDNLPNTVIESLALGIPVIGTRGASIDELVENEVSGELVEINDVAGLSQAILNVWQGKSRAQKGFTWRGKIADDMQPDQAVQNFLAFSLGDKLE